MIRGCSRLRDDASTFCATHYDRVRIYGHPTVSAPKVYERRRWLAVVRPLIQVVLADESSVAARELRAWHAELLSQARRWSTSLDTERKRRAAALFTAVPLDALLAALVCLAAFEARRSPESEDPRFYLSHTPKRLDRFYARQLRLWLAGCGVWRELKRHKPCSQICELVLNYRSPTTALQVASALHRKLEPHFREDLALVIRSCRERAAVKSEAERKKKYPYGGPDEHGRIILYRAEGD